MTRYRLKAWPEYFEAVLDGTKTFEVREDDRGFEVGDQLELVEWDPDTEKHTGRMLRRRVSYILRGPAFGIADGVVVMALEKFSGMGMHLP